ncbi:MAG: deoxyribose-phosphate aldolase [Brevefilum sp.]|nr:deoxyribose-phosphate aldolase [Brevefilum sp.]
MPKGKHAVANLSKASIEANLLTPRIAEKETIEACEAAKSHEFAAVCVKPCYVHQAVFALRGSDTKPATVIGFPFGYQSKAVKVAAAKRALTEGVLELNLVANSAYLFDGKYDLFEDDIRAICCLARMNYALVNIILNCQYLPDDLIVNGVKIIAETEAHWISPSSGLGKAEDDEAYFSLLKQTLGESIKLKSMGKVKNQETYIKLQELGCDRIALNHPEAYRKFVTDEGR